eukprot:8148774-Karenia_brevis.AAC.1
MTHVDCLWLTCIDNDSHGLPMPLVSFPRTTVKGSQDCPWRTWIENDLHWIDNETDGLPMADVSGQLITLIDSVSKLFWEPLQSSWAPRRSE